MQNKNITLLNFLDSADKTRILGFIFEKLFLRDLRNKGKIVESTIYYYVRQNFDFKLLFDIEIFFDILVEIKIVMKHNKIYTSNIFKTQKLVRNYKYY